VFRALSTSRRGGFVTPKGGGGDVYVDGDRSRNRAMDGDTVFVEIEGGGEEDGGLAGAVAKLDLSGSPPPAPAAAAAAAAPPPALPLPAWSDDASQASLWAPQFATPRVAELSPCAAPAAEGRRGSVLSVLSRPRAPLTVVGFVKPNHNGKPGQFLLHPVSSKLPLFFVAPPKDHSASRLYRGVHARGTWGKASYYPALDAGSLTCVGEACDVEAETAALLAENGIEHGELFAGEVVGDVAKAVEGGLGVKDGERSWQPTAEMLRGRRDFRQHRICTIDPTTAKDLDDALHITPLADGGGVEVGVHIADVSAFVRPGTAVDKEAE
jgi:DIS3-like exonuclease 2